MAFSRLVRIGQVAVVSYGPFANKPVIILDVVDSNMVVVDGPTSGVERQVINVKRLALTELRLKVARAARPKTLLKALEENDVIAQFKATSWGQKIARGERRATLTDFERFQVMLLKKEKAVAIKKAMKAL
jgi:large subunit ribosomal protein L14e